MGGVDGVDAVAGAAVDVVWEVLIITKVEVAGVGVGARGTQEGKARSDAERRRQRGGMENATEWHGSNLRLVAWIQLTRKNMHDAVCVFFISNKARVVLISI